MYVMLLVRCCMCCYKYAMIVTVWVLSSLLRRRPSETPPHGGSVGMAEIRLQTPEPFNFRNPDDWPRWKRRFHQFGEASGLAEAAASKQASTLLYCIGEEVESVLASTNATEDDRKDYARIVGKLDDFFQIRKNVI